MEKFFIVIFIVAGIIGMASSFFNRNKIQRYIKQKGGNLLSTKDVYHKGRVGSVIVKYYDRHKNLREVVYHENGIFSFFGDDDIIEYSKSSPEYLEILKKEKDYLNRGKEFEKVNYLIFEGDLAIQQEFTQINKNEFVFLNGIKAPNGKYKLGFMNYIIVENGKIKDFSML